MELKSIQKIALQLTEDEIYYLKESAKVVDKIVANMYRVNCNIIACNDDINITEICTARYILKNLTPKDMPRDGFALSYVEPSRKVDF